jgi:hypothetical protein
MSLRNAPTAARLALGPHDPAVAAHVVNQAGPEAAGGHAFAATDTQGAESTDQCGLCVLRQRHIAHVKGARGPVPYEADVMPPHQEET